MFNVNNIFFVYRNRKATLVVLNATKNDTGVFTCAVRNNIGPPVIANVSLIVKHKPVIDKSRVGIITHYILCLIYKYMLKLIWKSPWKSAL